MKYLILVMFLLLTVFSFGQQPWVYSYGGYTATNVYTCVDTTEMKTLDAPIGNMIFLRGFTNGYSFGEGWFVVEASTEGQDGFNVFNHKLSGYRFVRQPSAIYNYPDRYFSYFNDFVGDILFPTSTGAANGWQATGDATYDVLSAAGTLGGWCLLTAETGSNNEVYVQMGQLGTETFVEATSSSGKQWWFEVNFTPVSVTNAANLFIGLADETAEAANFIADAGDDIADNDVIGFVVLEGDPNALLAIYQTTGAAFVDTFSTAITATNMTVGIFFDGATEVYWFVNGTSIGSITISDTGFPDTEELSPLIGVKQGAADGGLNMDWIKLVVER